MESSAQNKTYDVVIVGGAIMGSSVAWFLTHNPDFNGSILVIECDPTYEFASTSHTNSCMRQQFSTPVNVKISQYCAEFIQQFPEIARDSRIPKLSVQNFGYLYLANTPEFATHLQNNQMMQAQLGAGTRTLDQEALRRAYPFMNVEDIICANYNNLNEGYFDGNALFQWWKRLAIAGGAEYICNKVVGITTAPDRASVQHIALNSGETISCGTLINAAGPRAAQLAQMAGLNLPVEPHKRHTYVFAAENPLGEVLPLTIDPNGMHVRSDGDYYMAGCTPDIDPAVAYDDFAEDHDLWMDKLWPSLANRIPEFERIKVMHSWVGHYAVNTFDRNAIIGADTTVKNMFYINGFSGHGLQQAPAMGRALSELITYGGFQTLDLGALGPQRLLDGRAKNETALI
ncbi:oxidoreductase [Amylibacter marinus]|uniref:Oxidoreductase n=1 Tax=Amylibacter marinus TaxID=1475483 RepID=A0ABQ5VUB2_9RHOB|nr:FAD-binding oxidoreductase [Amylibacter marinus]GLQ34693.1 oxidoreductase [Amylibacter marinus]